MSKTDYDLEKIKGIAFDVDGVLSPAVVPMDENGIPRRMANLRDGFALKTAVEQGLKICIITGGNDQAIVKRFGSLGITDIMMVSGPKLPHLKEWMSRNGLNADEVAYVGDDVPDVMCMRTVGLPVAPRDASIDAMAAARYITDAAGGYGVARELLEQILRVQKKWPADSDSFGK